MKIKIRNELKLLNLLVIVLIIAVIFLPSDGLRIALGLPFVLFFPGYVLVAALFVKREGMDAIERIALSFVMSIAVVPIIGLILIYTPWGLTLESTLYSVASFIVIMSVVAWVRRKGLGERERFGIEFQLRLPSWGRSAWSTVLSVIVVIAILTTLGILGYVIATPKVEAGFTEFYILGQEGKAADYPREFKIGEGSKVVLGIINHEHQDIYYRVEIISAETLIGELGPVMLQHEQKWEQEAEVIPIRVGGSQKVEFLLFREGEDEPYSLLHLWLDVKESK